MGGDERYWNREELYGEVWSKPMQKLAKKYGISDVGLAKVCRRLSIPLPGRGYWAKREAGQHLPQPPLPPSKDKVLLRKPVPTPEPPKLTEVAVSPEIAQIEQLEQIVGEVPLKYGSLSHPLILETRALITTARVDDRGILWLSGTPLDIRVSKDRVDRAIRIMAGLISIIEAAGFRVDIETQERKHFTVAKIHGQKIRFGVVEKVDRVEIVAPPKGSMLQRVLTYGGKPVTHKPSGRLSVIVWNAWGSDRKKWRDGKLQIEAQISHIVAGFIRLALADRAEMQQRAAEEAQRRRRAEEHAKLQAQVDAEKAKVRALVRAAAEWSRAEKIRTFVNAAREAAAQNGQSAEPGSPFGDWIVWAEQQADRVDPLKESPPSIVDTIVEAAAEHAGYFGYSRRDTSFRFPKPIWRAE